jgi:alpha-glucosidase
MSACLLLLCAASAQDVTAPPAELKADPWYKKHLDAGGIPILSSEKVSDAGLREARRIVLGMLKNRPDLLKRLGESRVRIMVMHETEQTTDVPEQRNMKPKDYWDRRARGLGGRLTSCGEENLLHLPKDRYRGENILVHEFGHCVKSFGVARLEPGFDDEVKKAYASAKEKGLWRRTYAESNAGEYWAEGVQSYFDCNMERAEPDGIHNSVNTREELKAYDPDLFGLVDRVFKQVDWRYSPPAKKED